MTDKDIKIDEEYFIEKSETIQNEDKLSREELKKKLKNKIKDQSARRSSITQYRDDKVAEMKKNISADDLNNPFVTEMLGNMLGQQGDKKKSIKKLKKILSE